MSSLPAECQIKIVGFLPGIDAGSLRLACRQWRDIAAEGLFNQVIRRKEHEPGRRSLKSGVLVIRPWMTCKSILEKLYKTKWAAPYIREVKIYLPDKDADNLYDAAENMGFMVSREQFTDRLYHTCYLNETIEKFSALPALFTRLPHVDTLSVLSKACPFLPTEEALWNFWSEWVDLTPDDDENENAFASRYQSSEAALMYTTVLTAIHHLPTPLKRLYMDSAPIGCFEALYGYMTRGDPIVLSEDSIRDGMTRVFGGSLDAMQDLNTWVVVDLSSPEAFLRRASSILSHFLDKMPCLQSLALIWSDRQGFPPRLPEYIQAWPILHPILSNGTWPHLKTLTLQGFMAPDELLLQLLLKHTSSLEHVAIYACFFGALQVRASRNSILWGWGPPYSNDNFRVMLEKLRGRTNIRELLVEFTTNQRVNHRDLTPIWELDINSRLYRPPGLYRLCEIDWKSHVVNFEEEGSCINQDDYLLNCFLHNLCEWPMVHDDPDLSWDGSWFATSWTKKSELAADVFEGPEEENYHCPLRPRTLC